MFVIHTTPMKIIKWVILPLSVFLAVAHDAWGWWL